MPSHELNTQQLESIHRLLIEPLREAVKAEVELSQDRLRRAVDQLSAQLTAHIQSQGQRTDDASNRLTALEATTTRYAAMQSRVLVVYGFLAMALSLVWSIIRDRLVSRLTGRG